MKEVIIDLKDISDSKEMYMSKPNPFLTGFIYILVAILSISIIYSCVGKIDIYSKAVGFIRPNDEVSTVSSLLSGKVTEVNVVDGQFVKEGDILYKVDTSDLELTLEELKETEADYLYKSEMYNKYLNGIYSEENPFKPDINGEEYYYYISFTNYALSLKNSEQQYIYDKNINDINIQNLSSRISKINSELEGLSAYKSSVEQNKNLCGNYPSYQSMYLLYESSINSMKAEYASGREAIVSDSTKESNKVYLDYYNDQIAGYDKLLSSITTETDLFGEDESTYALMYKEYILTKDEYKKKYENDPVALDSALTTYKNGLLTKYGTDRNELKAKADNLSVQLNMSTDLSNKLNTYDSNYGNSINAKYYQTITQIDSSIESLKEEKTNANNNLKLYNVLKEKYDASVDENGEPLVLSIQVVEQTSMVLNNLETCENGLKDIQTKIKQVENQINEGSITAEKSGTVNVINTVVVGDALSSGIALATIIPVEESEYKVQMYVSNSDIAGIKVGDSIKYNIAALPYNQYGIVEGKVTKISQDTLIQNGEYSGYYLVEGSISNETLQDDDGNTGEIGIGMQVTGRIVTQKKTIIRYLLEMIDLF